MRTSVMFVVASIAFGLSGAALAAGGGGGSSDAVTSTSKPADPSFAQAKALIEAKRYKEAMPLLQQAVAKDPRNADAYNLMGYERATSLTAIGDTVNIASRLESLTKEYAVELVVSQELIDRAGMDLSAAPRHEVEIRGRQGRLAVRAVERAAELTTLSS